jgi:uncharacterized protein YndB with AHSA1/START domain
MVTFAGKSEVSLPSDREVLVSRSFRAPRALVYRAYTEPDLVQRWMLGPPGWTMPVCEMDVRPGGKYRWRWRSEEDGKEFGFHGEFREVEAPARIVSTQFYDAGDVGGTMGEGALITVTFDEHGDGTSTLNTVMDFGSKESRDAAVATGMTGGMEQSFQLMEQVLAGLTSPPSR